MLISLLGAHDLDVCDVAFSAEHVAQALLSHVRYQSAGRSGLQERAGDQQCNQPGRFLTQMRVGSATTSDLGSLGAACFCSGLHNRHVSIVRQRHQNHIRWARIGPCAKNVGAAHKNAKFVTSSTNSSLSQYRCFGILSGLFLLIVDQRTCGALDSP